LTINLKEGHARKFTGGVSKVLAQAIIGFYDSVTVKQDNGD